MTTINAQTIINEAMAALAVAPDKTGSDFFDKIKIKTSERGHQLVQNNKSNIQKFIDLVRKNAAAFGGGLVRTAKPRPSVSWPANLVALFKQSIEDHDYRAALDIGDRLGALFYTSSKGNVFMQVAPVPCDFSERVVSVCNEDGKFSVIDPVSMRALAGLTLVQKRTRAAQVENVRLKLESMPSFDLDAAIDKQSAFAVDQSLLRAQWILEHGLDSEAIETRIDAHNAQIEEQASQDVAQVVAQVVAQAMAAAAISEAMADTSEDARELVTCEAGESEASAPTAGRTSWAPVPQYVPPSLSSIAPGQPVPPAFRGDDGRDDGADGGTMPPSGGNAEPTTRPVESTDFSGDIPLSLAVSAFGGVSMSPERRGASSKSEYGQSMAADYETLHAQAVKGGTLDLLPEVFARYRSRQAKAFNAYLASSSRCVSSFIAGPSNFPAARMNKRADIAHKRLNEYLDGGKMALQSAIRTLRPDLRAIMSGDADAIDRLTVEIEAAERLQNQMKACNKAIRATAKMDEAHKVAALMEIGYNETQAVEILNPPAHYGRGPGFPSYRLTNNQANIRRMRARLEQITAAKARPVESVECANGVTLEDDAPANRVRLFFPGKPSEAIRDELKASGFRWAPSVGAWQAYRNHGTLATAKRMAGEPVKAEENAQDAAPEAEIVAEVEIVAPSPVMESTEAPMAPVAEVLTEARAAEIYQNGIENAKISTIRGYLREKEKAYNEEELTIYFSGWDSENSSSVACLMRMKENIKSEASTPTVAESTEAPTPAPVEFLSETPAPAAKIIDSEGCHMAAGRADFAAGKPRILPSYFIGISKNAKDWYRGWDAANLETPTPPAMESQPEAVAPAVETWQMDALTFSKQSRDNPHWTQSYPGGDGDYLRDCFATHAAIVAAHEAKQAQGVPADNANEWGPAIGERYIGAVEYAVQEANRRGDGFEYRTGENALMERRVLPAVTQASKCTLCQAVKSKSEKWAALLFMDAGLFAMVFNMPNKPGRTQRFNTASERMTALQAMARAADAPTDTPPGGGLPCPAEAPTTPVATSTPGTPVAVSSAPKTTKARNGRMVLAKEYHGELYPMTYANRAQAYAAAEKHGGVVLAGHPFLVALDVKESEPTTTPAVSSAPAKPKIADIRQVIETCDWKRNDLGGATVNEFKAMNVPAMLTPHIDAVKALEIPPRFTKDIERQAWAIECAQRAIARWQAKQ